MVFVQHPIQDRTDDELKALADATVDEVVAQIVTAVEEADAAE